MNHVCGPAGNGLAGELDDLLVHFTGYLRDERALAPTTVQNYLNQARPFTHWYARQHRATLAELTAGEVDRFLVWRSISYSAGSMTVTATALRTLLRWMFLDGRLDRQLAHRVGPVHHPALAGVPKALAAADLAVLLGVAMSPRDRALLLLLARLGLRSKEAAELRLEDVDWRQGTLRITGKGADHQLMPLPGEVGEALAGYLLAGRPHGAIDRQVFLGVTAPYRPLGRNGVSSVVTRLARRAGLTGRVGAHRLRHSAATAVLAGGGCLAEAGQLLRHRSSAATAIYAKVDQHALRQLIRPWPGTPAPAQERSR